MDDEIDVIEQHPPSLLHAFDVVRTDAVFLEFLLYVLAERADVGVGSAARDDKEVRHVGDTFQAEHHDVVRLVVSGDQGGATGEVRDSRGPGVGAGRRRSHWFRV